MTREQAMVVIEASTKCAVVLNDLLFELKATMEPTEFAQIRHEAATLVAGLHEDLALIAYLAHPDLAPEFMTERLRKLRGEA